jgi:hypothetical protein
MFVGEQWRERFESVINFEETRVQTVTADDNRDVWIVCRDAIRKEVKERAAALSELPGLLCCLGRKPRLRWRRSTDVGARGGPGKPDSTDGNEQLN